MVQVNHLFLANIKDWVEVVDPVTGKKRRRETNTMPQWAGVPLVFLTLY
ncbi:hypothetical protein ACEQPO_22545 [Bacillus sp. SL00103]